MNAPLMEQFVLITGSPTTGFVLTGPFNTREEGVKFYMSHLQHSSGATRPGGWWIAPLFKPKE